jgi:hypothetical protein
MAASAATRSVAIIPLGPGSLRGSSSLPEGQSESFSRMLRIGPGRPSPPIWPCSTRGFPCPGCCHPGGGLLPHLFTLAKCARPKEADLWDYRRPAAEVQAHRRSIFCGTFRGRRTPDKFSPAELHGPLALPGASPNALRSPPTANRKGFGVRTFLPPASLTQNGPAITRLSRSHEYTSEIRKDGRASVMTTTSRRRPRRGL